MPDTKTSRTVTLSDEDWDAVGEAAEDMGFGALRGRGKAIVKLAKDYLKAAKKRDR